MDVPPDHASRTDGARDHGPVLHALQAEGKRDAKGTWSIELHPDVLRATLDGEREIVHSREEIARDSTLLPFDAGSFWTPPAWKHGLRLDLHATAVLRDWMGGSFADWGRHQAVRAARGSIAGGIGGVVFWWLDGPIVLLVFGLLSLITALAKRFRPGAWLLLLVAARSAAVAITCVVDIFVNDASGWWGIAVFFLYMHASFSARSYRFFTSTSGGG